LSDTGHKDGCLFLIAFYAPPKYKKEAMEDLEVMVDYLKKRYLNTPILIMGDFNAEEQEKEIRAFKENFGLIGVKDMKADHDSWVKKVSNTKTCKKRRIDYLLFRNVTINKVMIDRAIGNSDHRTMMIEARLKLNLERKLLCQMSKKFLTNKLSEVNLEDFRGVKDYLLLSRWLEQQNVPVRINKRNFFTKTQRVITNVLSQGDMEDSLIKVLNLITVRQLQKILESIPVLNMENKMKEMHNILKTVMKMKTHPRSVEGISDENGRIVEDSSETNKILKNFFQSKYHDTGVKNKFANLEAPNISLDQEAFEAIAKKINKNKGNGFDYIPLSILNNKEGKAFICSVVNDLFKQPSPLQKPFLTRLMLLSKTTSKYPTVKEIRPIAITTLPQKVIEHVLLERLEEELGSSISKAQFGFRPTKGTLMHVIRLTDRLRTIRENKPRRFRHCLVFIDFSTAFDSIDHDLLVKKMESFPQCSKQTINLLKWYLSLIHLKLDDSIINQNVGSPQGGVASPFMWLVYINDLLEELEKLVGLRNTFAFADDLLICCSSIIIAEKVINIIKNWSKRYKITLNEKKSAILPLALRKNKKDNFNKTLCNIPYVREYKYLGIIFDYTLKFESSLRNASSIVRQMNNYSILKQENLSIGKRILAPKSLTLS